MTNTDRQSAEYSVWPRISLRVFLGVIIVLSVVIAIWSRSAQRQRRAVSVLKRAGAVVKYDHGPSESMAGKWRSALASDYVSSVADVLVYDRNKEDVSTREVVDALLDCRRLRHLAFERDDINDGELIRLAAHKSLDSIAISPAPFVSDRSLSCLSNLPRLRSLKVFGGHFTSKGIAGVATSKSLERLYISELDISGDELAILSNMTRLRTLSLGTTRRITDDDLKYFKPLVNLELLILHRTEVSKAAWDELQTAFPRCNMSWLDNIEPEK
ncbi:MAG: hypothetical protein AB7U73_23755 [Pirellulales bacterium]